MKNSILTSIIVCGILGTFSAKAAITSGAYSSRDTKVLIQAQPPTNPDTIYGLILNEDTHRGALYRIEELADGTQAWIHLYQGANKILMSNADEAPSYKGLVQSDGSLQLTATSGSSSCQGAAQIVVNPERDISWQDFTNDTFPNGDNSSKLVLQAGQFAGSLIFSDASFTGSFALSKLAPGLASVRMQVLDASSISGWSLSRDMLGVVVETQNAGGFFSSSYKALTILKLPLNQRNCMDATVTMKTN